jgi:hypothetical protein
MQFNLIFAKNELMFDDIKASIVLQLFWNLLEFDPEDESTPEQDMNKNSILELNGLAQASQILNKNENTSTAPDTLRKDETSRREY